MGRYEVCGGDSDGLLFRAHGGREDRSDFVVEVIEAGGVVHKYAPLGSQGNGGARAL